MKTALTDSLLIRELRISTRAIARRPLAFVLTVACLGAGVGTALLAAGLTNSVLWKLPDGVGRPRQVYRLRVIRPGLVNRLPGVSYPLFRAIQERSGLDSQLAAFGSMPVSSADVAGRRLDAQIVSGTYFHVLRARPFVGRLLGATDDQVGRPPVAVVSYDLWRGALGSDPGIVGRRLHLNGEIFTVVGVSARGFAGIDGGSIDIWVPAATAPQIGLGASALIDESLSWLRLFGRVERGLPPFVQAAARGVRAAIPAGGARFELQRLSPPALADRGTFIDSASPARATVANMNVLAMSMLFLAVANCCVMLLLRIEARSGEFVVRQVLGAAPHAVAISIVAEAIVIAVVGAAAGLPLTLLGGVFLRLIPGASPSYAVDARLLGLGLGTVVLTIGGVALAPAFVAARRPMAASMAGPTTTARSTSTRLRRWLVLAQVALATTVLFAALLTIDGLWRASRVDTGIAVDALAAISTPRNGASPREVLAAARSVGGVTGVTSMNGTPFHADLQTSVRLSREAPPRMLQYSLVDTGYFRVVGTPLVAGNDFTADRLDGSPATVVVNARLAGLLWGSPQRALHKCLYLPPNWNCAAITGVSADALYGTLGTGSVPMFFMPSSEAGMAEALGTTVLVRVAAVDSLAVVVDRLQSLGNRLRGSGEERVSVRPMRDFIARELDDARTKATVFAALAACALCIAGLGVYAVQAYNTALRAKELAIRSALGSPTSRLAILLVSELGTFVFGGVFVGGAIAYVLYAPLSGIVFDARDSRPMLAFGLGALLFVLTGLGALMSPLRKALTTPVASVLRSE